MMIPREHLIYCPNLQQGNKNPRAVKQLFQCDAVTETEAIWTLLQIIICDVSPGNLSWTGL